MRLTALIPVYNDDYALGFCLASIVQHFDEIIVFDDASTDATPDVASLFASRHTNVRFQRHEGPQLGWVEARNRLAAMTDSEHVFWLDSDDVLCEYNAHLLQEIAERSAPIVRLRLTEMWGDFYHTTQRLNHVDRCHVYVNRRVVKDAVWKGSSGARLISGAHVAGTKGPGPLLFHIKGVKPDRRLVERQAVRGYLRRHKRPQSLSVHARLDELTDEEIHRRALKMLLTSRQDKLRSTYVFPLPAGEGGGEGASAPRRPGVIEAALPGRFEIVYEGGTAMDRGTPIDRIDHGPSVCSDSSRRTCRGSYRRGLGQI